MSGNINSIRRQLWEQMRNKSYRENFVAAHLSTGIAAQLITMRESREWAQKEVAGKTGMSPARISVMENPNYDKYTLTTLKRLASAFDVALIVRFAPFRDLVNWVSDLSPDKLDSISFTEDRPSLLQVKLKTPSNIIPIHILSKTSSGAASNMKPEVRQENLPFNQETADISAASVFTQGKNNEQLFRAAN